MLFFILSLFASPVQAKPPAVEVARALQQKYDRVTDFTADFTHVYEGGVLKKRASERGTVQIKKPMMISVISLRPKITRKSGYSRKTGAANSAASQPE